MTLLEVKNLTKHFGGLKAVDDVSFTIKKGEIVGLIGPNGSGKSTLFDLISNFYEPTSGSIFFQGEDVTHLPSYEIARKGIGRTFQFTRLFPQMTILENLLVGEMDLRGERFRYAMLGGKHLVEEEEKNIEKARELLKLVELESKERELAESLSYGQQKLIELVRAIAINPKLLMLDEPDAGLNPVIAKKVFSVVQKMKEEGISILLIEHDMEMIMELCDRIIVLDAGKKIAEGTPEEIQANKQVLEVYLGKVVK